VVSLSDSIKAIWDRLEDQAKSIILGYIHPTNTNSSSQTPLPQPPSMRLFTGKKYKYSPGSQTNLHEISTYDILLANVHVLKSNDNVKDDPNDNPVDPPPEDDSPNKRPINATKSKSKLIPPADISCVISKSSTRHASLTQTQYHVSIHDYLTVKNLSLIVRGANGGVTGEDMPVILLTNRTVEI
jgi:hypothetical protein